MGFGKRRATPPSIPAVPLVLVVGCPDDFVEACREAGNRLAVAVRECDLGTVGMVTERSHPFAIVVLEEVYQKAPEKLDETMHKLETCLVRLEGEDALLSDVQRLMVDAIFESAATGLASKFTATR